MQELEVLVLANSGDHIMVSNPYPPPPPVAKVALNPLYGIIG